MGKYQTIEEYVATEMGDKIVQKAKSPLAGLLTLAIGIGLLVMIRTLKMSDTLATLCLTVGILALCVGLILTGMCLTGALSRYIYLPTHSPMRNRKCYLSISDYKISLEAININKVSVLNSLQPVTSSNNALSLLYSRDHAIALLQAGCYEGNNFVPEAPVVCLTGTEVTHIQALCK